MSKCSGFHACIKTGWDGILVHMIYVQKSNLLNNKHNKTLLNTPQIKWLFIASKNPSLAWKCARLHYATQSATLSSSLQGWNLWFGSQREIIYGMYGGPETSGALQLTTTSANRKILQKHTKIEVKKTTASQNSCRSWNMQQIALQRIRFVGVVSEKKMQEYSVLFAQFK